jgi:hypothetical protein
MYGGKLQFRHIEYRVHIRTETIDLCFELFFEKMRRVIE